MKETLCWKCANPGTGGCSWDRCFVPVEGWTATPTRIWLAYLQTSMESFLVHSCPLFRPDKKHGENEKFGGIRKITDEQLLFCVEAGLNDRMIASMFCMMPETVYRRRRQMEKRKTEEDKK